MVFDRSEYMKKYNKKYYESNKEYFKEHRKQYYDNHKEQEKELVKQYNQTEKGKKVNTISHWKRRGVIDKNFDELYEKYINTKNCELCDVELTNEINRNSNTRCLDHDHKTGLFRNILCHSCNVKRR